jgi:hypothetical protein
VQPLAQALLEHGLRVFVDAPHELERIKLGTFTGPAGTFRQRTEFSGPQRAILAKLKLAEPPRVWQLTPAAPGS